MLNEWLDLQRTEVMPAFKKAGVKSQTMYATTLFGNAGEYTIIVPFEKYAEFDEPNPLRKALGEAGAARLIAKLRRCTTSSRSYEIDRMQDLSNPLDKPTEYNVSARYRISPGKFDEFSKLVKSDILPVYQKAKTGLLVSRRGVGGNPSEVTMTTSLTKVADLEGGPFMTKQLGAEGAAKVNAKFVGVRTLVEVILRRRVADMSW